MGDKLTTENEKLYFCLFTLSRGNLSTALPTRWSLTNSAAEFSCNRSYAPLYLLHHRSKHTLPRMFSQSKGWLSINNTVGPHSKVARGRSKNCLAFTFFWENQTISCSHSIFLIWTEGIWGTFKYTTMRSARVFCWKFRSVCQMMTKIENELFDHSRELREYSFQQPNLSEILSVFQPVSKRLVL